MVLTRCCNRGSDIGLTTECCGACHYEDGFYGIPLIKVDHKAFKYGMCCTVFKEWGSGCT